MFKLSCRGLTLVIALLALVAQGEQTKIENRLPKELEPIREAMASHWGFLYERAEPTYHDSKKATTLKRIELESVATKAALENLRKKGHVKGTGKALVMGGAYEVDLTTILEEFDQVDVVDLSEKPLELASRVYRNNPNYKKLHFFIADLSGLPINFQHKQLQRLTADLDATVASEDIKLDYFKSMPQDLEAIPFDSNHYDLVVSPILVESLPHGPLVTAFEKQRKLKDADRKGVDDLLGEKFFYHPEVMQSFARVFQHHSKEINRLLTPKGVAVFSVWMREDLKHAELAPHIKEHLRRVGDDRVTDADWDNFFAGWSKHTFLGAEQVVKGKLPTMNLYLLEK